MKIREIPFYPEMVAAIRNGDKTATRRKIKKYPIKPLYKKGEILRVVETYPDSKERKPTDLYIRVTNETTALLQNITAEEAYEEGVRVPIPPVCEPPVYPDDYPKGFDKWADDKRAEWLRGRAQAAYIGKLEYANRLRTNFFRVWDTTVKRDELNVFGSKANPCVHVIKFALCDIRELVLEGALSTKPTCFSSDLMEAHHEGHKSLFCRAVRGKMYSANGRVAPVPSSVDFVGTRGERYLWEDDNDMYHIKPPYYPGDIVYLRESVRRVCAALKEPSTDGTKCTEFFGWEYQSDGKILFDDELVSQDSGATVDVTAGEWTRSPVAMPKAAARSYILITNVRVKRLQELTTEEMCNMGIDLTDLESLGCVTRAEWIEAFKSHWHKELTRKEMRTYGWDANPWVWVIEYEPYAEKEALSLDNWLSSNKTV